MLQNRRRRPTLALLLAASALATLSCHREAPRPRNVIFILVDTLRADHLGSYGYGRATSPNVDAFAREAVRFDSARSQAACTFPSANSMLTSRWPAAFLGQRNQSLGIPKGIPSLAEILQQKGFRTVAVSASAVVRKTPSRFNPTAGFGRGFEVFEEDCVWKSAACVNRLAAAHLKPGKQPLFLYLHYIDPHGPYRPPKAWSHKFARGRPDKKWVRIGDPNPIGNWLYKGKPNPGFTPADLRFLMDLYDEEIAFFDARFAELLAALRGSGLLDDSIVVFASDHGEEFLEHENIKHCRTLFDNSIKVPLLLKIPGVEAKAVSQPAQNLDLVPTILDYLGIETGHAFEGRSLRPLIEEDPRAAAGELQYGMQGPYRSASDGRFKLIQDLASGAVSLFDLSTDPGETADVLRRERRAYARLRDSLAGWISHAENQDTAAASVQKAKEAEERLRSLGYIE
ncbi:MAG TPA: sulfatase [Thermoanaerobaculia bacterium]|jgi:arylsulfatase A-like enzyme|nr:sulfatase [Thermoanaerobaculia bacterium]